MLVVKISENKTMYSVEELHLCLFSFSAGITLAIFISSMFSTHSSANLLTNFSALTVFIV